MKQTRRKFDAKFKAEVAIESIKDRETLSELAPKYEVSSTQISRWKKEFIDNSAAVFETPKAASLPARNGLKHAPSTLK